MKYFRLSVFLLVLPISACGVLGFGEDDAPEQVAQTSEKVVEKQTGVPVVAAPKLGEGSRSAGSSALDQESRSEARAYRYLARKEANDGQFAPVNRDDEQADDPARKALSVTDKVHINSSGSQRWLALRDEPELLWPKVKAFWESAGYDISLDKPATGVLETDWIDEQYEVEVEDADEGIFWGFFSGFFETEKARFKRHKFRTRFERGMGHGITEIFVSYRCMSGVIPPNQTTEIRWERCPPNPEVEDDMLVRMMTKFGEDPELVRDVLDELEEGKTDIAEIVEKEPNRKTLLVKQPFSYVWRRVGLALDRIGLVIEDRDLSKGVYYVRYVNPESDKVAREGLFSDLSLWSEVSTAPKGRFVVFLKDKGEKVTVSIFLSGSIVDTSEVSKRVLDQLYEQLK